MKTNILRNNLVSTFAIVMLAGLILSALGQRQRVSPMETVNLALNGKEVTVVYSRPYRKNPVSGEIRKVFGELVPYGKVWRTGANEATALKTQADLVIGGVTVPAGEYTLYTVPGPDGWKLIINKQSGQWGTQYDQSQDLARVDMKAETNPEMVEQFTISLASTQKGGVLKMKWENTRASVEFYEKK